MMGIRGQAGKIRIILLIVMVVVAVAGYVAWRQFLGWETTDDAQVDAHIHAVNVRVGGRVAEVNIVENQFVEAGAVLVRIDDRDYMIALARAEADLADAQARYEEARVSLPVVASEAGGQISSSEASLAKAHGGVESARKDLEVSVARLNLARSRSVEAQTNYNKVAKDLDRLKPLIAKDEISQQQFDTAAAAVDAAGAALDSSRAAIAEAESGVAASEARVSEARGSVAVAQAIADTAKAAPQQVDVSRARIATASTQIDRARAALDQARTNIGYTVVHAPASGVVSRKSVEPGQIVQPGQPVMAIVALDQVWVTANFKETQLDLMRPGQTAEIRVDAFGGARFPAKVDSISAATGGKFSLLPAENASGNFVKVVQRIPVKLVLDQKTDAEHILRPGMSVVVTVRTGLGGR